MVYKKINTYVVLFAVLAAIITATPAYAWGKSTNVAVIDDYYSPSTGYIYPSDYPNQSFSILTQFNLSASTLANKDTLVLWAFDPSLLSSAQKSAINSWIYNGGKLIIWDAEEPYGVAGGWDYTWLAYPFSTSVPGAMGATGLGFWVAEENPLSSANTVSPYYIDTNYLNNNTDAIGDSNVFTSYSTSWCVDMKAKNYLGVEGPNHLYAKYGNGLMIYSGLDWDYAGSSSGWSIYNNGSYNLKKMFKQELEVSDNLPCGVIQTGTPTLEVTKTADKSNVNIGDTITFTITVTNTGNTTAYNVNLTDILPVELSATGSTTFSLGNLASGMSITRTLTATVVSTIGTQLAAQSIGQGEPGITSKIINPDDGLVKENIGAPSAKTQANIAPDELRTLDQRTSKKNVISAISSWGKSTNVAVIDDYYSPSTGYIYPSDYPNQSFSILTQFNLSASTLANKDTLVLWAFDPGLLSSAQKSAINSWIYNGGKLIIWDAEEPYGVAGGWDYTWLAYPFSTSVPGAMGATGLGFWVAEENPLSSANTASPYYIDTNYLNNNTDAIGDSNVFTSYSTSWCVDMKAKNYLGVEGPNHLYAKYGNGLMIYSGLDWDYAGSSSGWSIYNNGSYNLKKMFKQELEVSDNLPCGVIQTGTPTLEVTKTADKSNVNIGDTITFTITVTNTGNTTAYNVNLTDILPVELSTTGSTTFSLGNMAPGTSISETLTAEVVSTPATSNTVKNIANAVGRDSNQNIVAGSDDVTITIGGGTGLKYVKNIANAVGRDSNQNIIAGSGDVTISIGSGGGGCKNGVLHTDDLNSGLTSTSLVYNLLGAGVAVSNVTYSGANDGAGTFSNGTEIIGFDDGIILSSGDICNVIGPNTADATTTNNGKTGDTDLNNLIPGYTTYDAAVLEFDFVPASSLVTFEYVFGSEEYNEYVNSNFNDVFGFFVNGIDVALVPGTNTPISINNLNGGNPYGINASYPAYFRNNDLSDGGGLINTELDGLTVVLTATAKVNAGQKNHIKLAIADAGDYILDSDVFIKATSFIAQKLTLEPLTATTIIGSVHTLTAKLVDSNGNGMSGQTITFNVTSGPNAGKTGTGVTNLAGTATFNYTGATAGIDTIIATSGTETSNIVFNTWGVSAGTIVSIADSSTASGSNVSLPIMVENVTNLAAGTIWLTYDPGVVNVLDVSPGDLSSVTENINNTIGRVAITALSTTAKNGNVVFANVLLRAVGATNTTSPLILSVIHLANENGVAIPNTVRNGVFNVSTGTGLKGDVNGDGQINVVDALFVAQYTVGLRQLNANQLAAADTNCDGQVNVVDALFIAQYTVGLRTGFC